ncbi:TPA: tyrosine-type recombinase/integrase [Pseudomonas aeruginosa]|uniref:tyrosine-type recombinase/integrase n=1 Tax=Pseudomonas TaxID=286 RepID=UPI000AB45366|nr:MULTISPECIES: site-specific integrase [Pseudomonas]EKX2958319.1 site-specific integrase [Pseudomonas aeruginosa]MBG4113945.1 site-specific integrase [Pseudomonas aeruginosa]MBI6936925.1 site-specific integrase [Pseudomonas aeruginosa]MBI8014288.1 site-specific integrase [Pseudomonas aeruginosa]MBV6241896.1 site-specific integrase [Pseudomonas aeruginosa]
MARKHNKKLYELSRDSFSLPLFTRPDGTPHLVEAENIPMITWPDGRWCMEANIYMLRLYRNRYSRKFGGGTLLTYATQISHLLRYCFTAGIGLLDLTDSHFHLFINSLKSEVRFIPHRARVRSDNQVRDIGNRCLDFLESIGSLCLNNNYVSENGRIIISIREVKHYGHRRTGKRRISYVKEHRSFPPRTPNKTRLPISDNAIAAIKATVSSSSGTSFIKIRRYVMLRLFEATGGRRAELSEIRVEHIFDAIKSGTNMLNLLTLKQKTPELRQIPLINSDLQFIKSYIDIQRAAKIKKTCGVTNDSGYLFVNDRTGLPLTPNTLTLEMYFLRKTAGLAYQSCPHMFRHRYITKLFVHHLEIYHSSKDSNFISLHKQIETIKAIVMQSSGHKDPASLDHYINLAFEEASFFKASKESLRDAVALDGFNVEVQRLRIEIKNGLCPKEATTELINIFEQLMTNFRA